MKPDIRILILEDSVKDAELLERELRQAAITFSARKVDTRGHFVAQLDEFVPDLIISDYKLPAFDGLRGVAKSSASGRPCCRSSWFRVTSAKNGRLKHWKKAPLTSS